MKLIQPAFICSGRKEINCYYRGKVVEIKNNFAIIEFKKNGVVVSEEYDMIQNEFENKEFKDIKITKVN